MTVQQPAPGDRSQQHTGHPSGPLPQAPVPTNSIATTGLVLGIIAAPLALVPALGIMSWILAPLAIIFGAIGVSRSGTLGKRTAAIWGVVLGALGLIICFIWAVAFFANLGHASSSTSSTSSSGASSSYGSYSSPYSSQPAAPATPAGPVTSVTSGTYEVGYGAGQVPPGRYSAAAGSSSCYYERLRDFNDSINSIIANDNEYDGGPMIVNVAASDAAFKVSGDCTFVKR